MFVLVERKCECCGVPLAEEDVMKIVLEDGSCEVFPFPSVRNVLLRS